MSSRKRSASVSLDDSEEAKKSTTPKRPELLNTVAGYGCRKGVRGEMEDTHIILSKYDLGPEKTFISRSSFFAIFDGHAGPRAAQLCQEVMADTLKENLADFNDWDTMRKELKNVFINTYQDVEAQYKRIGRPSCLQNRAEWKDGTTATTMLILNNSLYVANVGDSRAVVARKKEDGTMSAICLTVDHHPMNHEERMRIQSFGVNVVNGRLAGVIEVSRSIGDLPFKNMGIICTPDIKKLTLTENDQFAIIACDGLWKVFSNAEAVTHAAKLWEDLKKKDIQQEPNESREVAELRVVAERMASEAVLRQCGDNVTVIIVKLDLVVV